MNDPERLFRLNAMKCFSWDYTEKWCRKVHPSGDERLVRENEEGVGLLHDGRDYAHTVD